MKSMSVDIETTGLIPTLHGITEFGAVFFDDQRPDIPPQTFYRWVNPEGYVWSTYCLALHSRWIGRVCHRIAMKEFAANVYEPSICENIRQVGLEFLEWYESVDKAGAEEWLAKQRGNITGTGKNFGSFDLQFLKAWKFPDVFRHRTLDWIKTYQLTTDRVPPELKTCKERAILMGCHDITAEVAHSALEDALDVYKLIMFGEKYNAGTR